MHHSWAEARAAIILLLVVVAAGCQGFVAWWSPGQDPISTVASSIAEFQVNNPMSQLLDQAHGLRGQMDQSNAALFEASKDMEGFDLIGSTN